MREPGKQLDDLARAVVDAALALLINFNERLLRDDIQRIVLTQGGV